MKLLQVIAHPREGSLSHQLSDALRLHAEQKGHQVVLHDLYKEKFDPILPLAFQREFDNLDSFGGFFLEAIQEALTCDYFAFFYPIWWWERPAILKGWFDRVFARGLAFKLHANGLQGFLEARGALVVQTFGQSQIDYQASPGHYSAEGGIAEGSLKLCGVEEVEFVQVFSAFAMNQERLQKTQEELCRRYDALVSPP